MTMSREVFAQGHRRDNKSVGEGRPRTIDVLGIATLLVYALVRGGNWHGAGEGLRLVGTGFHRALVRALRHVLPLSSLCLALTIALAGCGLSPPSNLPYAPNNIAPEAKPALNLPAYRVQVGDVLNIKFFLNPELNETVTVRPDGMISTALVSDFPMYNRTLAEINEDLKQRYKAVLKDPMVSAQIQSFAPIRVYVSGEVNAPGEFIVIGPNLTLTQAIARAGGIKNSGNFSDVLIIRRGAGEKPDVYTVDYDAATQGGDPTKDVRLAPYDVIFVPKTGIAEAYMNFQQYFQQFVPWSIGAGLPLRGHPLF